jgi:hypothetical protein
MRSAYECDKLGGGKIMNALIVGSTFYLKEMKDFFQANDLHTYCAENMISAIDILYLSKLIP